MTLHWTDLACMATIVVGGCAFTYVLLLGRLRRIVSKSQHELEHRMAVLAETIAIRESRSFDRNSATDALTSAEIESEGSGVLPGFAAARTSAQASIPEQEQEDEIPPPIQAAIAAAAIAAFGNHARVRSARRVPSSDVVSPWTQQGRVIVQSSHNLRTRGR